MANSIWWHLVLLVFLIYVGTVSYAMGGDTCNDKDSSKDGSCYKDDFEEDVDFDDFEDIEEQVRQHGVSRIELFLRKKRDEWKNVPVNVAVTGCSGSGKSSLINAIRGLTADDDGAAPVGVVETTSRPTPFAHPFNPNLKFWDLPGIGTPKFPKDSYLESVKFRKYDFFLILSSERFKETDIWLAKEIKAQGKTFFFIRTKIDVDIDSDKQSHPKSHNASGVLKQIRGNIKQHFLDKGILKPETFLVSNFHPANWDFPIFLDRVIEELPDLKRESLILSLNALTEKMVKMKRQSLQSRCKYVAVTSALGAHVPIPGASIIADIGLLMYETQLYQGVFGLDEESLQTIANAYNIDISYFKKLVFQETTMLKLFTKEVITSLLKRYATGVLSEEVLRMIPVAGSIIASGISYSTTFSMLNDLLDEMEKDAITVLRLALTLSNSDEQ